MSGHAELERFIRGVESLRTLNEQVAREAEKGIARVARETAAAGTTPSGEKWPERKDGGKALRGAPNEISSSAKGTRVELKIGTPYVFHNYGAGGSSTTKEAERARKRSAAKRAATGTKSKFHAPRRQILPDVGEPIPAGMREAIEDAAARVLGKAVG